MHQHYEDLFVFLLFLFYAKQLFHPQSSYYSKTIVHQIVL